MGTVDSKKQEFQVWLSNNGYEDSIKNSVVNALNKATTVFPSGRFWEVQDASDYFKRVEQLKKNLKVRLFYKNIILAIEQYGFIYAEYLKNQHSETHTVLASSRQGNNPEKIEEESIKELPMADEPDRLVKSSSDEHVSFFTPVDESMSVSSKPSYKLSDKSSEMQMNSSTETEKQNQSTTKIFAESDRDQTDVKGGSAKQLASVFLPENVLTPSFKMDTMKKGNKTYFQDEMEKFYLWLTENKYVSSKASKSCISALKTCELFAKENIARDLDLFSDSTDIVVATINSLITDPDFRKKDTERRGRYSSALKQYQQYLEQCFNATGIQSFFTTLDEGNTSEAIEPLSKSKKALCELLDQQGIQYWTTDHNYVFTEAESVPQDVLRQIKRMEDISSVTTIRRFRKNCLRIRLDDKLTTSISAHSQEDKESNSHSANKDIISTEFNSLTDCSEEVSHPHRVTAQENDSRSTDNTFKATKDPLLNLFAKKGLVCNDMRSSGGRLWIIGDASLKVIMQELRSKGIVFIFAKGGSKSINWQSGWYLSEEKSKLPSAISEKKSDKKISKNASYSGNEKLVGKSSFPEDSSFIDTASIINTDESIEPEVLPAERYKLVTGSTIYLGKGPAGAFAAFCDDLAVNYPGRFHDLIDKRYYGSGPLVLSGTQQGDYSVKINQCDAFISATLSAHQVLNYCQWISRQCGENDYPLRVEKCLASLPNTDTGIQFENDSALTAKSDKKNDKDAATIIEGMSTKNGEDNEEVIINADDNNVLLHDQLSTSGFSAKKRFKPATVKADYFGGCSIQHDEVLTETKSPTSTHTESLVNDDIDSELMSRMEQIVLQADLDGITLTELASALQQSISTIMQLIEKSEHIIRLNEKIIHEDSFVDWEDGAKQLDSILNKLLDRNDGYVSAAQLYEYAHIEMQMFLNDNNMDSERQVYELAQYLFGKVGCYGTHLSFQSKTHISRRDVEVSSTLDVIRNYALSHDGIVNEKELSIHLQRLGIRSYNLHQTLRIYNQPIFFIYGGGTLIYAESMGMDEEWFVVARDALNKLFSDLGDHVILRDIQSWWFTQLPSLPGGISWTLPLLQNVLYFYSDRLGAHTINAMSGQSYETVHAMLVSNSSEVQTFPDAVAALLLDSSISERRFEAEHLRRLLVKYGMIAGGELSSNIQKVLAKDCRFAWDADGQHVTVML